MCLCVFLNQKVDDEVLEDSSTIMSDAEGSGISMRLLRLFFVFFFYLHVVVNLSFMFLVVVGSDLMEEEANFSTKVKAKEHKEELHRLQEKVGMLFFFFLML